MENFEKLDYILDTHMNATAVTSAFGFKSETMLSKMRKGKSHITKLHIDGLEKYFDIPHEVFTQNIKATSEIDALIKSHREIKQKEEANQPILSPWLKHAQNVFSSNEKLFKNLQGVWYAYVYPSNPSSAKEGIWEVKTTINEDYSVVDYWGNKGYIQLGKHESLIIKESYDNDDLTIIRFSNRQVPSQHICFVIISNQNNTPYEMVNFGFYSRKQYSADEAKEILGDINTKQLKLDLAFNDRLNERAIVPQ